MSTEPYLLEVWIERDRMFHIRCTTFCYSSGEDLLAYSADGKEVLVVPKFLALRYTKEGAKQR